MMHPLVEQLRFARSEWRGGLRGVPDLVAPDADGRRKAIVGQASGGIVSRSLSVRECHPKAGPLRSDSRLASVPEWSCHPT
jgi:hypothetical protein